MRVVRAPYKLHPPLAPALSSTPSKAGSLLTSTLQPTTGMPSSVKLATNWAASSGPWSNSWLPRVCASSGVQVRLDQPLQGVGPLSLRPAVGQQAREVGVSCAVGGKQAGRWLPAHKCLDAKLSQDRSVDEDAVGRVHHIPQRAWTRQKRGRGAAVSSMRQAGKGDAGGNGMPPRPCPSNGYITACYL